MANSITIPKGATLSGLAKQYNTSVNDLLKANPNIKNPNLIIAGASLNLPTVPEMATFDKPKEPIDIKQVEAKYQELGLGAGTSYTIKSGDTLSALAKANNTTIAEIMKLNPTITNPNLIYAGKSLNLPGGLSGEGSDVKDYSGVNSFAEANKAINENQEKDAASKSVSDEPPTRKTTVEVMEEIETAVKPTTEKPAAADFMGAITNYRSEYGVTALETQLDDLRAQEQDLLAAKATRVAAERGKTVATNVIEGRVSEVERQENERIGVVQRSIANATNQLNTKYNIINTLMKAKEMDYNSAVDAYDKEMTTNISTFNAAKNIEEADKSELEREKDNARSNAQIAINALTASGMTYDQLSPGEQTNLTKLGVQSGLGADFFANVLKNSTGKDILTTIVSADDTKATILYKDGTTKTISTGLPAKVITGDKPTTDEVNVFYKQSMRTELGKVVGGNQKVSPSDWAKARANWAANTPYDASAFDEAFINFVDPTHPQDYAGYEGYMTIMTTDEKGNEVSTGRMRKMTTSEVEAQ